MECPCIYQKLENTGWNARKSLKIKALSVLETTSFKENSSQMLDDWRPKANMSRENFTLKSQEVLSDRIPVHMKPQDSERTDPGFREIMRGTQDVVIASKEFVLISMRKVEAPFEFPSLFGPHREPKLCARECPYSSVLGAAAR